MSAARPTSPQSSQGSARTRAVAPMPSPKATATTSRLAARRTRPAITVDASAGGDGERGQDHAADLYRHHPLPVRHPGLEVKPELRGRGGRERLDHHGHAYPPDVGPHCAHPSRDRSVACAKSRVRPVSIPDGGPRRCSPKPVQLVHRPPREQPGMPGHELWNRYAHAGRACRGCAGTRAQARQG